MAPRSLRQLLDHFGPKIELLDINRVADIVNFTCFTEKQYIKAEGILSTNSLLESFVMLLMLSCRLFEQTVAYLYCRGKGRLHRM